MLLNNARASSFFATCTAPATSADQAVQGIGAYVDESARAEISARCSLPGRRDILRDPVREQKGVSMDVVTREQSRLRPLIEAAGVCRLAVDEEHVALNGEFGVAVNGCSLIPWGAPTGR